MVNRPLLGGPAQRRTGGSREQLFLGPSLSATYLTPAEAAAQEWVCWGPLPQAVFLPEPLRQERRRVRGSLRVFCFLVTSFKSIPQKALLGWQNSVPLRGERIDLKKALIQVRGEDSRDGRRRAGGGGVSLLQIWKEGLARPSEKMVSETVCCCSGMVA